MSFQRPLSWPQLSPRILLPGEPQRGQRLSGKRWPLTAESGHSPGALDGRARPEDLPTPDLMQTGDPGSPPGLPVSWGAVSACGVGWGDRWTRSERLHLKAAPAEEELPSGSLQVAQKQIPPLPLGTCKKRAERKNGTSHRRNETWRLHCHLVPLGSRVCSVHAFIRQMRVIGTSSVLPGSQGIFLPLSPSLPNSHKPRNARKEHRKTGGPERRPREGQTPADVCPPPAPCVSPGCVCARHECVQLGDFIHLVSRTSLTSLAALKAGKGWDRLPTQAEGSLPSLITFRSFQRLRTKKFWVVICF